MIGASVIRVASAMALLGLSCGRIYKNTPSPKTVKTFSLLIWIDPNAKISEKDTLQACEEWAPKGVECFLVDKRKALVHIYAENKKKCPERKDGNYTLALAYKGGDIVFNMRCFGAIGSPHRHKFRAVMVHEIGHQLGIWDHVPLECTKGQFKKHPSGKPVCGVAVMNPVYTSEVYFMTPVDALAFDIRDLRIAVIVDRSSGARAGKPDCVYLER